MPLVWHSYLIAWILGLCAAVWALPALFCLCILLFLDRRLWTLARLTLVCVLALVACLLLTNQLGCSPPPAWLTDHTKNADKQLCGEIHSIQGLTDQRLRILLRNVSPPAFPDEQLSEEVAWTWEQPVFRPLVGQHVCLSRPLKPVHGFANFGLGDYALWWRAHNVSWLLWSKGEQGNPVIVQKSPGLFESSLVSLRHSLLKKLEALNDSASLSQAQAMLPALLFGDKSFLSSQTVNLFAQATLAHSLALSGQHLAVAGLAGFICVVVMAWFHPHIFLQRPRLVWIFVFSIPPAMIYLVMGNAPASLIRAACMLVLVTFFQFLARPKSILDILAMAAMGILLVWPAGILDTGLQLSVSCLVVIGLFFPSLRKHKCFIRLHGILPARLLQAGFEILCISLLLQIVLSPLNLLLFSDTGFWFPLNLVWLPLLALVVLPCSMLGLLFLGLKLSVIGHYLLLVATMPCEWILHLLHLLEDHALFPQTLLMRPHWTYLPASLCIASSIALHFGGDCLQKSSLILKKRLAVTGLLCCLTALTLHLVSLNSSHIRLSMYDVGQGQAISIRTPGPVQIVLDGGGTFSPRFDTGKALVLPSLSYNNSPHINAVIASHPDRDHIGGLFSIVEKTRPALVLDNGQTDKFGLNARWQDLIQNQTHKHLVAGDVLVLGKPELGLRLHVLHPPAREAGSEKQKQWQDNDASLVLRLTHHGQGLALFPGDAGTNVMEHLIKSGQELSAQILIASHHGSDNNFHPDFFNHVRPKVVLASCGFQNRFGFPGEKLKKWLEELNIPLYHTDATGGLSVTWKDAGNMSVESVREGIVFETSSR